MKALTFNPKRRRPLAIIVLGAAVLAVAGVLSLANDRGHVVYAMFDDAAGLRKNSEVQIAGVPVGAVEELEVTEGDDARARLRIDASAAPVGRNARAYVRPANLFGEKYVELEPGDTSRPAGDGAEIPRDRTGAPVELDDLLAVLDTDTRARLSILIHESGTALAGRGADFNAMLTQLPQALDQASRLIGDLASDNQALGSLIEESDRVLAAIASERAGLGRLVDSADGALSAFARRHRGLGQTIQATPPLLIELQHTLARLDNLSRPLGPAASALRSTAQPLAATLQELPTFTRAARPTLRVAREAAPRLERLGRDATPVLRRLRRPVGELATFSQSLDPVAEVLDGSVDDILAVLEGWARATQARDGLSHLFRGQLVITEQFITSFLQQFDGRSRRGARPPRPSPAPAGARPDAAPPEPSRQAPRRENDGIPDLTRPDADQVMPGDDGVQVLLDYLLAP